MWIDKGTAVQFVHRAMSATNSESAVSLVTGAAGFIGSHLVDRLLERGARVIGIDNLVLGTKANLQQALCDPHFQFGALDLNETGPCLEFLSAKAAGRSIDTVWHLAANSDIQAGVRDPDVDLRLTFLTTFNVLKMMHELRIPRIVFASTSAIYGDRDGALVEDSGPLFPISSYGAMKLASEGIISAALERFLERAWICRFPNVVGSRATHGAIYDFIRKLRANPAELEVLGDGAQEKPYLEADYTEQCRARRGDGKLTPLRRPEFVAAFIINVTRFPACAVVLESGAVRGVYSHSERNVVDD